MLSPDLALFRPSVLTLCQRLVGDRTLAEDIAQETLLVALVHQREGRTVRDVKTWLLGVARTLCKNAARTRALRRETDLDLTFADPNETALGALLDAERAAVLDQAIAQLDPEARQLLLARYIDERPVQEIAREQQTTENAISLRLGRARERLTQTLATAAPEAALAHGLIDAATADGWTETALFCPRCGNHRMHGRLATAELSLRCPDCDRHSLGLRGLRTDTRVMPPERVLAGARGFRVAQKRVNSWWQDYVLSGMAVGRATCLSCGRSARVVTLWPGGELPGFTTVCPACGPSFYIAPQGLLFHDDDGQRFWHEHPRLRCLPAERVHFQGRSAVLVAYTDRQSSARLEAIYAADDLTRLK